MKNLKDIPKKLQIYPYSMFYVFFEQYATIKGITLQNYVVSVALILCLVSVCLKVPFQFICVDFLGFDGYID